MGIETRSNIFVLHVAEVACQLKVLVIEKSAGSPATYSLYSFTSTSKGKLLPISSLPKTFALIARTYPSSKYITQPRTMSSFYGSVPLNHTAKWHPEPSSRGTFSIFSSCLITMGLCIWTAVHLNIPEHGEAGLITGQSIRKIKWLYIGLFAPEYVAFVAFRQRQTASRILKAVMEGPREPVVTRLLRKIRSLINALWRKRPTQDGSQEWSMTHSYYAAMGGFAVDISHDEIHFLASTKHTQFKLTPEGFLWVQKWRPELIPTIRKAEINDKSKASALAKTLVCLQALWFCIQCVLRLSQNLTISLLELNTFAHAICTLLIYVLWWDKPLDIEQSSLLLQQSGTKEVVSFLLVLSACNKDFASATQQEEFIYRQWTNFPKEPTEATVYLGDARAEHRLRIDNFFTMYQSQGQQGERNKIWSALKSGKQEDLQEIISEKVQQFRSKEEECLRYAKQIMMETKAAELLETPPLHLRVPNGAPDFRTDRNYGLTLFDVTSFIFAGICYGGLHLTAWNAPFPTPTQQLLWKVACVSLIASGPVMVLLSILVLGIYELQAWLKKVFSGPRIKLIVGILNIPLIGGATDLFLMFYILCRAYLIVECFISLAYLPDSLFLVPNWSRYFPHIT
ncbi:hypothetical protein P280DRAFT_473662 [Massarina eburnea CBS 473.64]|uniref:Uncharacterized protein n=1 Tax=Massarina eburnea CBS 473.64 TaxID=1395130 RepID=A0A6A6RJQ3_9PLEO|nr:hypothetical protein P280DRAFT_473662 [Massarina eburnea CBS 473.64]